MSYMKITLRNPYLKIFTILFFLTLFFSCEKELDFKYHDIDPLPVAEGFLTEEGARVRLSVTTPMDNPMDTLPTTDASVSLEDLTDGTSYNLFPDEKGIFRSGVPGIIGHEYRLTMDRDGKIFSSTGIMNPPAEISEMVFDTYMMPYGKSLFLKISFRDPDPAPGTCFWIRTERNDTIWHWNLVTDHGAVDNTVTTIINLGALHDVPEDEDDLRDGDRIRGIVAMIPHDLFQYFNAVSNDSSGPVMFSGGLCLGFFLPAATTSRTIVFSPSEL